MFSSEQTIANELAVLAGTDSWIPSRTPFIREGATFRISYTLVGIMRYLTFHEMVHHPLIKRLDASLEAEDFSPYYLGYSRALMNARDELDEQLTNPYDEKLKDIMEMGWEDGMGDWEIWCQEN